MKTDMIADARGLNHWFGTGEARKQALFDIDLSLPRGSLTVLMGPSGSGKTTVLTLIGCLRAVQEGSVRLMGHELQGARVHFSIPQPSRKPDGHAECHHGRAGPPRRAREPRTKGRRARA
jgi:ABC-type Fe3+/spermidine/putrescine transport system ATPase subunit